MKLNKEFVCSFSLVILCTSLGGCVTHRTIVTPLQNGYSKVAYYHSSPLMEEDSAHSELQYQDRSGNKEVVWPFIVDEVINDDTAVLIGMLESETGFRGIHIFAFQPSGPVVDITDGVLEMAAKERQESFEHLLKASPTAGVSTLKKQDRWVAIGITSTDWSSEIRLSWIQISDMVREAKQTGITRKDLASGTTYMEKKFKPEVQK